MENKPETSLINGNTVLVLVRIDDLYDALKGVAKRKGYDSARELLRVHGTSDNFRAEARQRFQIKTHDFGHPQLGYMTTKRLEKLCRVSGINPGDYCDYEAYQDTKPEQKPSAEWDVQDWIRQINDVTIAQLTALKLIMEKLGIDWTTVKDALGSQNR